jgi:hypothetical protein
MPLHYNIFGQDGKMTQPWAFWFQNFAENLPPGGSGYVINGSAGTTGDITMYQGLDAARGSPSAGDIYVATDTGKIYVERAGLWVTQIPAFTGDVTSTANSTTLNLTDVFFSPGTYGSGSQTPILTVDSKGRITNLALEPITASVTAGGAPGNLQWNLAGSISGTPDINYDAVSGSLTFTNPEPTFNNLSPLTTLGDLLTHSGTTNVRLPIGAEGQYLRVAAGQAQWQDTNVAEIRFAFGDATPKPLVTVPAGRVIKSISINTLTAFDDVASTVEIVGYVTTTDVSVLATGTYTVYPGTETGAPVNLELTITPGVSTQGAGLVTITLED